MYICKFGSLTAKDIWLTSLQGIQHTHIHTICCCITGTYNKVFIILTNNFSKEHYVLPEDDLRIETCRSLLNVLV